MAKSKRTTKSKLGPRVAVAGGVTMLTGLVMAGRGLARYQACKADPATSPQMCAYRVSGPDLAGAVLVPLGMLTLATGGVLSFVQTRRSR